MNSSEKVSNAKQELNPSLPCPEDDMHELWKSTAALHYRFFGENPPSFEVLWRVFMEEVGEFLFAFIDIEMSDMDAPQEGADVLVTLMGLLQYCDFSYQDFQQAVQATIRKNDSKTLDTHEVDKRGKISKKVV